MLWMVLTLMTALASVGLAIPLVRRRDAARAERNDAVLVLKEQLGEIEAQASAGLLATPQAEALKGDLKRRVLAEGRRPAAPTRPLADRTLVMVALGVATIVSLAGAGLYLKIGRPDVPSRPALPAGKAPPGGHPQGDVASMIGLLETQMQQHPDNAEGWRMLGWSYLQTGRNADAAQAYGKAAALDPANAEYLSAQGEATVLTESGQVTPAAEAIFRRAVSADPGDPRARYYLAVAKDQRGEHKAAMDDWIALLRSAPPDAPWASEVRAFVERVAADRGLDISSRLPPAATAEAPAASPGPTTEQMAAAQGMGAGDRQLMIHGMVDGLAERLRTNPRDRAGWEQLMKARMVLGQPDKAAAAYRDASRAFAGTPADQQVLRATALGLGIPVG